MAIVQILVYFCFLVFLLAAISRVVKYATTPVHMRWELYPVAHEKDRHHYGGSNFEEFEWWTKKREIDHVNELKEMAAEILLLKGVRLNNPKLWLFSFPFHFGLYILCGWLVLVVVAAIMSLAGADATGGLTTTVNLLVRWLGLVGMGLTLVGAVGLFLRRLTCDNLRKFSTRADFFNLLFFVAAAGYGLAVHLTGDPHFTKLMAFSTSVIGFRAAEAPSTSLAVEFLLGSSLIGYIPLTRMGHFLAKYFLYHDVRWSDDPNPRGGKLEGKIMAAFGRTNNWGADHVQSGKKWVEVVTEEDK